MADCECDHVGGHTRAEAALSEIIYGFIKAKDQIIIVEATQSLLGVIDLVFGLERRDNAFDK